MDSGRNIRGRSLNFVQGETSFGRNFVRKRTGHRHTDRHTVGTPNHPIVYIHRNALSERSCAGLHAFLAAGIFENEFNCCTDEVRTRITNIVTRYFENAPQNPPLQSSWYHQIQNGVFQSREEPLAETPAEMVEAVEAVEAVAIATPSVQTIRMRPAVAAVQIAQIAEHSDRLPEALRIQQEAMDRLFDLGYSVRGVENGLIMYEREQET